MVHHPDRANCFKSLNSLVFDHRDIVGDRLTGTRIVDIDYVGEASSLCFLSKRAKRDALLTSRAKRDALLTWGGKAGRFAYIAALARGWNSLRDLHAMRNGPRNESKTIHSALRFAGQGDYQGLVNNSSETS
jgi:hypothetical protein